METWDSLLGFFFQGMGFLENGGFVPESEKILKFLLSVHLVNLSTDWLVFIYNF